MANRCFFIERSFQEIHFKSISSFCLYFALDHFQSMPFESSEVIVMHANSWLTTNLETNIFAKKNFFFFLKEKKTRIRLLLRIWRLQVYLFCLLILFWMFVSFEGWAWLLLLSVWSLWFQAAKQTQWIALLTRFVSAMQFYKHIFNLFRCFFADFQNGSTTAVLFEMEQLFIKFGNDLFQFVQIRHSGRCHFILWWWVFSFNFKSFAFNSHSQRSKCLTKQRVSRVSFDMAFDVTEINHVCSAAGWSNRIQSTRNEQSFRVSCDFIGGFEAANGIRSQLPIQGNVNRLMCPIVRMNGIFNWKLHFICGESPRAIMHGWVDHSDYPSIQKEGCWRIARQSVEEKQKSVVKHIGIAGAVVSRHPHHYTILYFPHSLTHTSAPQHTHTHTHMYVSHCRETLSCCLLLCIYLNQDYTIMLSLAILSIILLEMRSLARSFRSLGYFMRLRSRMGSVLILVCACVRTVLSKMTNGVGWRCAASSNANAQKPQTHFCFCWIVVMCLCAGVCTFDCIRLSAWIWMRSTFNCSFQPKLS